MKVEIMDVENWIRETRTRCNLTQEELALRVGVTRQTIIAIEKGNYTPSVMLALKLAQVLGGSVDDLFWLRDDS
jgi:putative transcriptional regulator